MQAMKHHTMFTEFDKKAIGKMREQIEICTICKHCQERMKTREILTKQGWTFEDYFKCLKDEKFGKVIEVRFFKGQYRLVIRSNYAKHGNNLIFSITENGCLVTSYLNSKNYHHKNLCMEDYDKDFKIAL